MYNEYKKTGYIWETYDAIKGNGNRGRPFCGWSCLIILIINEDLY